MKDDTFTAKEILVIMFIILFFFQLIVGLVVGLASSKKEFDNYTTSGCDRFKESPKSYFGYIIYPGRIAARVGCFLIEPRFN